MINRKTTVELHEGVNLHMVHSDKFKTVLFGLYIRRPLNESEVAFNALLSRVIDKATSKVPTERAMNQALEMLYGSLIVSDVHKYGEKQMLQIKLQVPGETYIGDSTLYKGTIEILNDMFNAPRLIEGGFDPEIVRREKEGLISEVELRRDNKEGWVVSSCIETMCKDEIYRIHEFGTAEAIAKITPVALFEHMRNIWKHSEIDICVIGDFEASDMLETIQSTLVFDRGHIDKLNREQIQFTPEKVTYFDEAHDLTQGKMAMGYRMNIPYESPLYSSVQVASVILGGGGSSRFFKVIREKEGLCYTIYSRLEKYKSIMLVYAGVDFENFERTEKLVEEQIADIKAGNITDEELEIAKKTLISNIQSISDYPNSYINYYYNLLISENSVDADAHVQRIRNVTKESIVAALSEMRLDTVARLNKEAAYDA